MTETDENDESMETESFQEAKSQVQKKHQIIKSLLLNENDELVDLETFEKRLQDHGLTMFEGDVYVDDPNCLAYTVGREALDLLREEIHPSVGLRDVENEAEEVYRLNFDVCSIKEEKIDESYSID